MTHMRKFVADRSGATAIEYALVAGLVSIVILTAVQLLGATTQVFYELAAALF